MTKRKFYKTILHLEILSEEPIPDEMSIADIYEETISGSYSGRPLTPEQFELDGKQAADALIGQDSSPEFFGLTEEGDSVDPYESEDVTDD